MTSLDQEDSTLSKIDTRIHQLAAQTCKLSRHDSTDKRSFAALSNLQGRWQTTQAPVILAGEVSTGKSMLINALIGEKLLPTDARAWTSTWARIHYAPKFRAMAHLREVDKNLTTPISRDDLDDYLTVDGQQALRLRHGDATRLVTVDIGLDADLLKNGLELLDTPGVGGLQAAHRHTALAGLIEADAVLFVTKPGPISSTERLFLADAVERVSVCVIVFTHRDQRADPDRAVISDVASLTDFAQWNALLGDAQRAQNIAERFAAVSAVSVSSLDRLRALREPAGTARDNVTTASNIAVLEDILRHDIAGRIGTIHRRNIVGLCRLLSDDVARSAHERRQLLLGDTAAQAALEKREESVRRWTQNDGDHWQHTFDVNCGVKILEGKFRSFAEKRCAELKREYRGRLQSMGLGEIHKTVEILGSAPENALTEMIEIGRSAINGAIENVRRLLTDDNLDDPLAAMSSTRDVQRRLRPEEFVEIDVNPGLADLRLALTGGMSGAGVVGLGAAALGHAGWLVAAAAAPIVVPFLVGAALFGGHNFWQRRKQNNARQAIDYLDEVCHHVRTTAVEEATAAARKATTDVRKEIQAALEGLAEQVAQDRKVLEEADDLARKPAERQVKIDELEKIVQQAKASRGVADELLAELG